MLTTGFSYFLGVSLNTDNFLALAFLGEFVFLTPLEGMFTVRRNPSVDVKAILELKSYFNQDESFLTLAAASHLPLALPQ